MVLPAAQGAQVVEAGTLELCRELPAEGVPPPSVDDGTLLAPLVYVSAAGFTSDFEAAAHPSRDLVVLWSLKDLYGSARRHRQTVPDVARRR